MKDLIQFVSQHVYLMLFLWVLAEQIGFPLPAIPILIAAGSLVETGRMNILVALGLALAAALLADCFWFYLGRVRGGQVLSFLCRVSLEPDSCVRKTEVAFATRGAHSLLIAKFVPGFNTAAPPLAGITGMPLGRFLLWDTLGSLILAGRFLGLGYVFGEQITALVERGLDLGSRFGWLLFGALVLYIAWKYWERQRFI